MKNKLLYLTTALLALFTVVIMSLSCGGESGENVVIVPTAISLDREMITLQPTEQTLLKAEVMPANAADRKIKWTVTSQSVAMVSDEGVVTALLPGQTDIIATTHNGLMATCRLTVLVSVTGVRLNQSDMSLSVGGHGNLYATIDPFNATNKNVRWTSNNHGIATVIGNIDGNGLVTGIVEAVSPGTTFISVVTLDGAFLASCTVTVRSAAFVPVEYVTLNRNTMTLSIYNSETLVAGIVPSYATNQNVSWSSSNSDIAAVSQGGTVTGMDVGTAIITVTTQDRGEQATCVVTVVPAVIGVTGVSVDPVSLSLVVGDEAVITPIVLPTNATDKFIQWESSDVNVATVSSDGTFGTVTAGGSGKAIITATTRDGFFTAECEVNVADVYVAGYEENVQGIAIATLWVNGRPQALSSGANPAYANSVFALNGNVYVTGYEIIGGTSWAKLWINGGLVNLTNGKNQARAASVFMSNGNIYVAGYEEESQGIPSAKLWVNGIVTSLPYGSGSGRSEANSVYVQGNNVYVAGYEELAGVSYARLWINGDSQQLGTGSANAVASSVFVLPNGRICVAGYESTSGISQNPQRMARLWVDGEAKNLSNVNNYASAASVFASGSDVHAVGYEYNAQLRSIARRWRWENSLGSNTESNTLSDGSYNAAAASVFIYGNKVYAVGYENNIQGRSAAILWVNGFKRDLTLGTTNARADAVFVR